MHRPPHAFSGPAAMPSAASVSTDKSDSGDLRHEEIKDIISPDPSPSPRHRDAAGMPPRPSPNGLRLRHPPDVLQIHLPSPRSGAASNAYELSGESERSPSLHSTSESPQNSATFCRLTSFSSKQSSVSSSPIPSPIGASPSPSAFSVSSSSSSFSSRPRTAPNNRGQYSRSISMNAGMTRVVGSVTSHHHVDSSDMYAFCPLATSAGGIPTPRSKRLSESGLPGSRSFSTIGIPAARPTIEPLKMGPLMTAVASGTEEEIRDAVYGVRRALKGCPENKERLIRSGGIPFLIGLMKSPDPSTVEHAVTAIFNICRMEAGQKEIFTEGGLEALVDVLRGEENNEAARENAAAAIFCLANTEDRKQEVVTKGALLPLVRLLQNSSVRGQRDAALTLWSLFRWLAGYSLNSTSHVRGDGPDARANGAFPGDAALAGTAGETAGAEAGAAGSAEGDRDNTETGATAGAGEGSRNGISEATQNGDGVAAAAAAGGGGGAGEAVEGNIPHRDSVPSIPDFIGTGVVPILIGLLQSSDQGLEERSMAILSLLSKFPEGRSAIWKSNGVEVITDVLEMSSQRAQEEAVATLLRMATSDVAVKGLLVKEGVIPSLHKIHKSSEGNAGLKAKTLIEMLRVGK